MGKLVACRAKPLDAIVLQNAAAHIPATVPMCKNHLIIPLLRVIRVALHTNLCRREAAEWMILMYEWNEAIQQMINWIEEHLTQAPTLLEMSRQIGYSPYYCSSQFHAIVGCTLKRYLAGRKLGAAAVKVRDTDERILDIALEYGFSSQQAFTRAFVCAFGCTPASYRKHPRPIPLSLKKEVLFPEYYPRKGDGIMNQAILTQANVRIEHIPAHLYLSVCDKDVQSYFPFWDRHSCDEICGTIESMQPDAHPVVGCHTGGWFWQDGKRGYSYGLGVPLGYSGLIPAGFTLKEYPASYYLVFYHPPFDFLQHCEEVVNRVETLSWNFDPQSLGYAWNENNCQDYQRMMPETLGYEVLRPIVKL